MARMSTMKTLCNGVGRTWGGSDGEEIFDFDYEDEAVDFRQHLGSGTGRSSSGSRYQPHSQVRRYCDVRTADSGGEDRGGAEDGGAVTVVRQMRVSFDTYEAARRARALP